MKQRGRKKGFAELDESSKAMKLFLAGMKHLDEFFRKENNHLAWADHPCVHEQLLAGIYKQVKKLHIDWSMPRMPPIVNVIAAMPDLAVEINVPIFNMMNGHAPGKGTAKELLSKLQQVKAQSRFQRLDWQVIVEAALQSDIEASIREIAKMESNEHTQKPPGRADPMSSLFQINERGGLSLSNNKEGSKKLNPPEKRELNEFLAL